MQHDHITNVQKDLATGLDRLGSVPIVRFLLRPTAGARRDLQHRRSHTRTLRMCSRRLGGLKTRRPRHYNQIPEVSQQRNPGWLIFYTTAAVPGRSVALDVCVASHKAAAARGDAAQAAFDRKLSNFRH